MTRIAGLLTAIVLSAGPAAAHPGTIAHVHLADGWGLMLGAIGLGLCAVFALTARRKP